jgi:hypothetical protein
MTDPAEDFHAGRATFTSVRMRFISSVVRADTLATWLRDPEKGSQALDGVELRPTE